MAIHREAGATIKSTLNPKNLNPEAGAAGKPHKQSGIPSQAPITLRPDLNHGAWACASDAKSSGMAESGASDSGFGDVGLN